MRLIEDLDLDLDGLRVLIGENGSGKSTILEALEILRRAPSTEFWRDLYGIHGGPSSFRRLGSRAITLGVTVELCEPELRRRYDYSLQFQEHGIEREHLEVSGRDFDPPHAVMLDRSGSTQTTPESAFGIPFPPTMTSLSRLDVTLDEGCVGLFISALSEIQVRVPFEVRSFWVANAHALPKAVRSACLIAPAPHLERLGTNLPNAYQALRNEISVADWHETMDWIRLGLGDWVETVTVRADASGGNVALWVKHAGVDLWLPARSLSEGELQFLGIAALCRLGAKSSIVSIDEPEAHLHPHLQDRVMQLLAKLAEKTTVLVSTHSRHMLDALEDPAKAVRICRRTEARPAAMELRSLDSNALASWIEEYGSLGRLLNEGLERLVVRDSDQATSGT